MLEFILEDELVLKLLENSDAEHLFKLTDVNREYLKEWLPWLDGTKSVEDTKAFIELTNKQYMANDGVHLGIWYKGELAGVIGFHGVNWANRLTSMGYWLGETYRGQGIMTKACKRLVEYAMAELNLNRVEIRCAEKNYRSRAIPERLNLVNEGMIREAEWLYDHFVNHVVYSILAREWFNRV